MSETPVQQLLLGEQYDDGSGWRWAVMLTPADVDGRREVKLGAGVSHRLDNFDTYLDADPKLIRQVAAALTKVADILDPSHDQ